MGFSGFIDNAGGLNYLKETGTPREAKGFKPRGDSKTYCLVRAGWISHNKITGKGIQVTLDTLYRCIETLKIDSGIYPFT